MVTTGPKLRTSKEQLIQKTKEENDRLAKKYERLARCAGKSRRRTYSRRAAKYRRAST